MVQINDDYYEDLTPEEIFAKLLDDLAGGLRPVTGRFADWPGFLRAGRQASRRSPTLYGVGRQERARTQRFPPANDVGGASSFPAACAPSIALLIYRSRSRFAQAPAEVAVAPPGAGLGDSESPSAATSEASGGACAR